MRYYDVYNDGGFVMRTTLPMIATVFGLHRDAVERIKRDTKEGRETDLHIQRYNFSGCYRVFAATTNLRPVEGEDIFPEEKTLESSVTDAEGKTYGYDKDGNYWSFAYNNEGKRVRVCIPAKD